MSRPNSSSSSSAQDLPSVDALRTIYADKQVGELFEFGRYSQDDDGESEPITWKVLKREADCLLVIAEQCLDCQPYHEEFCDITWADCTLRRWLNDEFMNVAFNEQERECVLKTSVVNNAGPTTEDYIFLLSEDEVRSLFENDDERCAEPTEYAVKNGASILDGYCEWWLRTSGFDDRSAADVSDDGEVAAGYDVIDEITAVRPALKLAL